MYNFTFFIIIFFKKKIAETLSYLFLISRLPKVSAIFYLKKKFCILILSEYHFTLN